MQYPGTFLKVTYHYNFANESFLYVVSWKHGFRVQEFQILHERNYLGNYLDFEMYFANNELIQR